MAIIAARALLALDEAYLRATVAAAGWTRGRSDGLEAAAPLARWLGPRGSSVACKRRLSRSQWAETLGWLVGKLRLVGDKDSDIEAGRAAGVARLFKVVDSAQLGASSPDIQFVTALSEVPSLL